MYWLVDDVGRLGAGMALNGEGSYRVIDLDTLSSVVMVYSDIDQEYNVFGWENLCRRSDGRLAMGYDGSMHSLSDRQLQSGWVSFTARGSSVKLRFGMVEVLFQGRAGILWCGHKAVCCGLVRVSSLELRALWHDGGGKYRVVLCMHRGSYRAVDKLLCLVVDSNTGKVSQVRG